MTICRKCGKEIPDGEELCEECQQLESSSGESYLDELMQSMGIEDETGEEPAASEEPTVEPETDDINELLDLLSKDYEDEDFDMDSEDEETSEEPVAEEAAEQPNPMAEVSFFSEDESDEIFADSSDGTSVDDIFQDALSVVEDYSEKEDDISGDDLNDVIALDSMMLDESEMEPEEIPQEDSPQEGIQSEPPVSPKKKQAAPKKTGDSFWKRIFGNIITEQTAEEEAKEREQEKADAEERAIEKEEKKKQAAAIKEEKAEKARAEKERRTAEKAERAAVKAAEKEEKKRQKAQLEAAEVVGRINPVGAAVVMVFFAVLCICVIFGTQIFSYSRAMNGAESDFEARDYQGAYESLAGVKVSESSQEMEDKIRICMQLQKELNSYSNYYKMKMYLESLDSLMKGIRSYDMNKSKADQYGIMSQYNELEGKLAGTLYSEFGVSETQARDINNSETQEEYTAKLEEIIRLWEAKNKEDER